MRLDPKKDPSRRCRPVTAWPIGDQLAWEAALAEGDVLDPGGGASQWAPHSQRKIAKGYGRWLTWMDIRGLLESDVKPATRVTPERVRDYVLDLRNSDNAPYTVLARVQKLYHTIRVMAPEQDWAWLRAIENRVRHGAASVRNKRSRILPAAKLIRFGIELMTSADEPKSGTALQRAIRFRDGLIIAVLAARPLRRGNFTAIEIGRHLVREGERFWLRFRR